MTSFEGNLEEVPKDGKKWDCPDDSEDIPANEKEQRPHTIWIGCADSRVSEANITGCQAGHIFVLRNIANLIHNQDDSVAFGLHYGIKNLGVRRVVIVGHTHCGGCQTAMRPNFNELPNYFQQWLQPIRDSYERLEKTDDKEVDLTRLIEENVRVQVRKAVELINGSEWAKDEEVKIYGYLYNVKSETFTKLIETAYREKLFVVQDEKAE